MQQLWPAPVLWKNLDAAPDRPYAAFWIGDGMFALYSMPRSDEEMRRLWGLPRRQARMHLMSLYVADLNAAEEVFRSENIRIISVRRSRHEEVALYEG